MKKGGILNPQLAKTIAELGHMDKLVICDCGLPIPVTANRIDLTLKAGVPKFADTLKTVLSEIVVERVILADEIKEYSPRLLQTILDEVGDIPIDFISHEALKATLPQAKGVIRTGECTPYANIILVSGVSFA